MATEDNQTQNDITMRDSESEPLDPIEAARWYGIDVEALKANLARPVEERLRRHEIAMDLFRAIYNKAKP